MNEPLVLIIDDEPAIRKLLEITLESNGFQVLSAANGKEGLVIAANHPPALIILDIGLPDMSGHELLLKLREWYQQPILMLSVLNSEADVVKALDNGANDYLSKPFRSGELIARIRTCLRSTIQKQEGHIISIGAHQLDLSARTLTGKEGVIKLTQTEYDLLALLAKNEGRVLTHSYLLQQVWGPVYIDQTQYLRVFIAQLRKKIEVDPNQPKHLITEAGVGYRLMS